MRSEGRIVLSSDALAPVLEGASKERGVAVTLVVFPLSGVMRVADMTGTSAGFTTDAHASGLAVAATVKARRRESDGAEAMLPSLSSVTVHE
jgi:hypothetical protein